jgi:hypothetical protein
MRIPANAGATSGLTDVQDPKGVLARVSNAELAASSALRRPTKAMLSEAAVAGSYEYRVQYPASDPARRTTLSRETRVPYADLRGSENYDRPSSRSLFSS